MSDAIVIGVAISVIVLLARWLFPHVLVAELLVVLAGGVLLSAGQFVLHRYRQRRLPPADTAPVAPEAATTTPLHSPRLEWPAPAASAAAPDQQPGEAQSGAIDPDPAPVAVSEPASDPAPQQHS